MEEWNCTFQYLDLFSLMQGVIGKGVGGKLGQEGG